MDDVWRAIADELARRRHPWAWLAGELGMSEQAVNNWRRRGVPATHHSTIARALGWSVDALLGLAPRPKRQSGQEPAIPPASQPVLGLAQLGTHGYYDEQLGQDGRIDGYPSNDPDAYALRVKGDSMHPAIRNGNFVIVEPNTEPAAGDFVAIALKDGRKMVKELVIPRRTEIVVESVNGGERLTISRDDIDTCHLVAATVTSTKWRP